MLRDVENLVFRYEIANADKIVRHPFRVGIEQNLNLSGDAVSCPQCNFFLQRISSQVVRVLSIEDTTNFAQFQNESLREIEELEQIRRGQAQGDQWKRRLSSWS